MIYMIYSIYDRVSGTYSEPFLAVNEETAKRRFNYLMQNAKMVANDCSLYFIGEFDSDTAVITQPCVDFVCNYEVKANE